MATSLWTPGEDGVRASIYSPGGPVVDPEPPEEGIFLDNFTGAVMDLTAHEPDIAPPGYVWIPSFSDPMELTGAGEVTNTADAASIYNGNSTGEDPWDPVTLPETFYYDVAWTVAPSEDYAISIFFGANTSAARWGIEVDSTAKQGDQALIYFVNDLGEEFSFLVGSSIQFNEANEYRIVVDVDTIVQELVVTIYINGVSEDFSTQDTAIYVEGVFGHASLLNNSSATLISRVSLLEGVHEVEVIS